MELLNVVVDDGCLPEMGVRTNVPFRDLTQREKEIVFDGPAVKKHIFL